MHDAHIVIVEDDADCAVLIGHALRLAGSTFVIVSTPQAAIQIALSERPHAIVIDVNLDGEDGRAIIPALRQDARTAGIAPILVSAYPVSGDELGVPLIQKPFTMAELRATIAAAIEQRGTTEMAGA